jgi:hypothetical protein
MQKNYDPLQIVVLGDNRDKHGVFFLVPVAQSMSSSAIIGASVWVRWRSNALGSGALRTSPLAGRVRLFFGLALSTGTLSFLQWPRWVS